MGILVVVIGCSGALVGSRKDEADGSAVAVGGCDEIDDGGLASGSEDLVRDVGRVSSRTLHVGLLCEHRVVEVVGEVQLGGVHCLVDVDHHVEVDGPPRIPAGVDRGDLDHAGAVGVLPSS
jgi:hypothetical protein